MASASNAIDIWDDIMKYAQTLERRIQELEKELKDKEDKIKSLSQNSSSSSSGASTTSSSGISAISSSDAIAVTATAADLPPFNLKKHLEYIMSLNHAKKMDDNNDGKEITFESVATDHLKMQGVFWAVGSLSILGKFDQVKNAKEIQQITDWVMECYHPESGGFGGNVLHDPHLLHTQHAIYVLALCGTLSRLTDDNEKKEKVIGYIVSRQLPDGSFAGDQWGEVDIRFSYCAFISLRILDALDRIDLQKAMEYIVSCQNFDGGFGCAKGVESHAGYIFTAVAALSVGGGLELVSKSVWDRLSWWLCERQCDSGGLNGRPEKQADVCYSWWVLSRYVYIYLICFLDI